MSASEFEGHEMNPTLSHPALARRPDGALQQLSEQGKQVVEDVKKLGHIARHGAAEGVEELQRRGREVAQEARHRAEAYEERVFDYARERPLKAMLIALGIGACVGLWLRR